MIYVVVALSAEARPLCAHLRLEKAEKLEPLSVYRRSDMALIVSGVGKDMAASAVDNLARAVAAEGPSVWLNVGVAGHRDHAIGTAVLAREVDDAEQGTTCELAPPADLHIPTGQVRTVSQVETQFEDQAVYEMEAAAFCREATQLTATELVQVLKIISDNRRTGTLCVSAHQVQGLVESNLPKLDLLISNLHRRARRLSA